MEFLNFLHIQSWEGLVQGEMHQCFKNIYFFNLILNGNIYFWAYILIFNFSLQWNSPVCRINPLGHFFFFFSSACRWDSLSLPLCPAPYHSLLLLLALSFLLPLLSVFSSVFLRKHLSPSSLICPRHSPLSPFSPESNTSQPPFNPLRLISPYLSAFSSLLSSLLLHSEHMYADNQESLGHPFMIHSALIMVYF